MCGWGGLERGALMMQTCAWHVSLPVCSRKYKKTKTAPATCLIDHCAHISEDIFALAHVGARVMESGGK